MKDIIRQNENVK